MNEFVGWFRRLGQNMVRSLQRFMEGRYGTDRLNTVILTVGVVLCLLALFIRYIPVNIALTLLSYGCMGWAIFRILSRNTYRRYRENRRFLMLLDRIKDREHRYFDCPRCHQPVRVPRGKGRIAITCPKCQERFIRKT